MRHLTTFRWTRLGGRRRASARPPTAAQPPNDSKCDSREQPNAESRDRAAVCQDVAVGHHQGVFNVLRRWRERSARARRLASLNACPECGHNWGEHGDGNDLDGVCGECAYEVEHGLRPMGRPGCRLRPADREDRAYHEEIAGQLHGLLDRLDDRLPGKDVALVAEFIDAGELCLALEQMADVLSEDEKPLSADERADMLALVDRMRMDDRVPRALAFCPER